jgi:hypothetical protein
VFFSISKPPNQTNFADFFANQQFGILFAFHVMSKKFNSSNMKRAIGILMVMAGVFFMNATQSVQAQGRGHHHGRNGHHKNHKNHDHDYDDHHVHHRSNAHCRDVHYHVRPVRHVRHVHHSHCDHRTVVVEYHRPRYIYYRDYNVYYDCHRSVYIVFSGRNWTISTSVPVSMARVDIDRADRWDVDYEDDDLPEFLTRREQVSYRN